VVINHWVEEWQVKVKKIAQGIDPSTLYVVATPIGNLGDISRRALDVLDGVHVVAAEDTRHTRSLLNHFKIQARLVSLHEQNEARRCRALVTRLEDGESIALVSDAGTPLISDPGYRLVCAARASGFEVRAIPGASAITAALSICGLPIHRFVFEGFLPARTSARRSRLADLSREERTLVFFESPRRLISTLADMQAVFDGTRQAALVREISKRFETVITGTLAVLEGRVRLDTVLQRGEVVIVVDGFDRPSCGEHLVNPVQLVTVLREFLPPRAASVAAARITGGRKNDFYRLALEQQRNNQL
jgi:16S rRNA (cytidine1402-2'-O)-methyltransferase